MGGDISLALQSNSSRFFKRKTGPVAFKSLVTLDKLPFRLGIQVYMEEDSAIFLVFSDGSGQAR